jgi:MFS family permease
MLEPVLPLYLTSLGHSPALIGVIAAAFSVASFGTRPFLGQAVDSWSARGVYVLGALVLACSSFSYLLPSLVVLLCARTVHGFGWAAINTGGPTIASRLTPPHRRAEALGYFAMMISLGPFAPALGLWLVGQSGFPAVFVLSGCLGLAAAVAAFTVSMPPSRTAPVAAEGSFWGRLIERRVVLPAVLNFLLNGTQPILVIFVALYATSRGIQDISVFFIARALSQVAALFLVRAADRWGRAPVIAAGFAITVAGLVSMMEAESLLPLVIGGALCSAGSGLVLPSLMALAIDKTPIERRGAALGTYTAAYQVGQGAAALLWGFVIEWTGYIGMFIGGISMLLIGLLVLGLNWRSAGTSGYGRSAV